MTISLAGPWTLHSALGEAIGPIAIPGDVHSALHAAGRIPDPLIRRNEADIQWVGDAEWEIRRRIAIDPAASAGKWAVLDLEFVDTFATVTVNGFAIGECSSAFRRYRFDVTDVRTAESAACRSGEVLQGLIKPHECAAFGTTCTPRSPLGATMVSSEGACAAYYLYRRLAAPAVSAEEATPVV